MNYFEIFINFTFVCYCNFVNIYSSTVMQNNSNPATPDELEVIETKLDDGITFPYKVILFNDEIHTFDEVIAQLLKAINCTYDRAETLTWEIHTKGKACVFEGDMPECLKVSAILEEIGLVTQIEV